LALSISLSTEHVMPAEHPIRKARVVVEAVLARAR
jgi:hypothetical protein